MHQLTSSNVLLLLMMMVTVTTALEVEQCTALSGELCTFPFSFNDTEYSACTGEGHPIGRPRCFITVKQPLASQLLYNCSE